MYNSLLKKYQFNFYKAIILAFFFTFSFSNNLDFKKCIWIKSDQLKTQSSIENVISNAYRSGYKIIFAQIDVHENSNYNPILNHSSDFDPLERILYWSNLYSLEVHIWINSYKIWSSKSAPPKNHIFYQLNSLHQDWFTSDINGYMDCNLDINNSLDNFSGIFLSPLHSESNEYIKNIIEKLLIDYSRNGIPLFDGIHLDYLRYKDSMYGYNYIGRKNFYNQYKVDPVYLNRGIYLNDSTEKLKYQWNEFKSGKINLLVKSLNDLLNSYSNYKDIKFSVAVKSNIYEAKTRWNQNWDHWINNNDIDFVVVMNYFPDTESFSKNLFELYKYFKKPDLQKIYIGINTINQNLGVNELKDINTIREQVKNTLYYPFGGIALFSYEYYKYNPEMYLEIFPEDN